MARSSGLRGGKPKVDEDQAQIAVVDFLLLAWPEELPFWHTPNGGSRATVERRAKDGSTYRFSPEAKKLKRMGVLPGVPDLQFILPNGQTAFIEMKTPDGVLSDDQIKFRAKVIALGCGYAICITPEDVEMVLTRWLGKFGLKLRASLSQRAA